MKFLCWLLGHKIVDVIEFRYRKSKKLYQFGGYRACKRCGKKFTSWHPMWTTGMNNSCTWGTKEDVEKFMKEQGFV